MRRSSDPPVPNEDPPTLPGRAGSGRRADGPTVPLGAGGRAETPRRPDHGIPLAPVTSETEGRYVIRRELAAGGQAWVYVAYDTHLEREIAFKQPRITSDPDGSEAQSGVARFLREAKITARLEHPNIVPVHEIGRRRDGSYYCTQKLIRADHGDAHVRTLRTALKEGSSLDERLELLPHFLDVCNGIAYAHEQGILHRDIKPDNVVIGRLGETVILDWGIAKVVSEPEEEDPARKAADPADAGVTDPGHALGTPSYMSPEQAAGHADRVDERSDIWSLGAVLYELVTGRPPFVGETSRVLAEHVSEAPVVPVRSICPEAPAALAAVAEKALERAPPQRYPSAAALSGDIAAYDAGLRVGVYRYSLPELLRLFVARHRTVSAVVVISALLLAGAAAVAWWNYGQAERYLGESRQNLALAFVEKAHRAERQLRWDRAAAYYAAARTKADLPEARWGAMLTRNRRDFELTRLRGHPRHATAMAVSPGGRFVAGTGFGNTITIWDVEEQTPHVQFDAGAEVHAVAFAPGGGSVATVGEDGWVTLWPLDTGEPTRLLRRHEDMHALAFSPNGARIAIGTEPASLTVYDRAEDEVVWERHVAENAFYGVEYTPDGAMVVAVGWDRAVRVYDAASGQLVREIADAHDDAILGVRVSPRGDVVATGGRDGLVKIWNLADGALLHKLEGHTQRVSDAAFSPDGELLATCSTDGTIRLWDAVRGELVVDESYGHHREVNALGFSPDGDWLAFASEAVYLRRIEEAPRSSEDRIESLAVSADGSLLSHSFGSSVHLRDTTTGEVEQVEVDMGRVHSVFSADGTTLFARCHYSELCAWDVATKELLFTIEAPGEVLGIDLAPDRRLIAIGDSGGTVTVWDAASRELVAELPGAHGKEVFSVAFSPDGDTLVSASYAGPTILWDTTRWDERSRLEGHRRGVRRVRFSPDGQLLATASWDRTIGLWDPGSGKALALLEGHQDFVYDLAFAPDGRFLVSGSWDGTIRIWDVELRRELVSFVSNEVRVSSVAWLPGGDRLAYAGHAVHLLDLEALAPPDAELARILDHTGLALRGIELERR